MNCDHVHIRYGDESKKDHIVPKHIKDMMFLILNLGNIKSHSAKLPKDDIDRLERYLKDEVRNSIYLIFSLAMQICEITMWIGRYIDEHLNKEDNLKKCVKLEEKVMDEVQTEDLIGIVKREKGYYHIGGKYCLNPKTIQQNGWFGKRIRILRYDKNTNEKTKDIFPYFAVLIQLLEEPENGSN